MIIRSEIRTQCDLSQNYALNIIAVPATGASQQDIKIIGKVEQC